MVCQIHNRSTASRAPVRLRRGAGGFPRATLVCADLGGFARHVRAAAGARGLRRWPNFDSGVLESADPQRGTARTVLSDVAAQQRNASPLRSLALGATITV